jgi:hypothetical protein
MPTRHLRTGCRSFGREVNDAVDVTPNAHDSPVLSRDKHGHALSPGLGILRATTEHALPPGALHRLSADRGARSQLEGGVPFGGNASV